MKYLENFVWENNERKVNLEFTRDNVISGVRRGKR